MLFSDTGTKVFVCVLSFSAIPIKIPTAFLTEQLTLKLVWKHKKKKHTKKQIAKKALRQTKLEVSHSLLASFHNYKASVIKTVWCWTKDRHIYQLNREHKINQCFLYGQPICDIGGKNIKSGKNSLFVNSIGKLTASCKRIKQDGFLTPDIKINSK